MSFEYTPSSLDKYTVLLLIEVEQMMRDESLLFVTAYHDRITDALCLMNY